MQDLLQEVLDEQKESLNKYKNHNVRVRGIKFFPFDKDDSSKTEESKQVSLVKENPIEKEVVNSEKANELEQNVSIENKNIVTEKAETTDFFFNNTNKNEFDLSSFALFAQKKYQKDAVLRKEEDKRMEEKRRDESAKKKIITETYLYLFKNFLNYSLVFNEFPEIVRNFPKFLQSIPEVTSSPKKVRNIKDFVYKLRTVSLIQKINILAYQIGRYNFSLIVDELYDASVLNEYSPEDFAVVIFNKYKGSSLDYEALLTLYDVADADMHGKIIFDINQKQNNEQKKEDEKVEDKKEKRRKTLGFGSFTLRK